MIYKLGSQSFRVLAEHQYLGKMQCTHCIFDMDGLLLDTEKFYTVVQQKILQRFGKEFTWELKAKMMGKKALEAARTLVDTLQLQDQLTPEEFVREREHMLDAMFPESELMPGAERLILHLKASGVPICVATSSHRRHFERKTTKHTALFSLFDHIVTGDMVSEGKPAPDIFLSAAAKWSVAPQPGACLVFEDAPSGVAAACAAGMQCVMVPDPNLTFTGDGATLLLSSLLDFKPEAFGLPPFK